ncbi:MAG: hypothetical protein NTY77_18095 [Elusimicrobia bacterium]|nr:hypothetical protein [Elusimicrobiota bacterium]
MSPSILAVFLLALASSPAAAQSLDFSLEQARSSFRTHQPGQPYAAQLQARLVQEGCPAPCTSAAEIKAYLDSVAAAARSLSMSAELAALREHYAPAGVPRKKGQAGAPGGPSAEKRAAQTAALQRQQTAAMHRGGQMAAALDQRKKAESLAAGGPGGGITAGKPMSPAERKAALDAYLLAPAGDSARLHTLAVKAPPPMRPRTPVSPPQLSRFDRALLWVDSHIDQKKLEKVSNFSAGFGDALTFGGTGWVRKKISGGTDPADRNSDQYTAGTLTGVGYSMLLGAGGVLKPLSAGVQTVTRWAPTLAADGTALLKEGQFVMAGTGKGVSGFINWNKGGGLEQLMKYGRSYLTSGSTQVPGKLLRYPIQEEGRIAGTIKGLMGQRVYTGPTIPLP